MNNRININPSSTKWLEKEDRVVADYFCDLGFRSLKQILDMRVFDLMNMQGLNAVRVEEVIICLYKWLNPNTAIDEAIYNGMMSQPFLYTQDRMYPIEMTLQGARCCISIGKGVIKALGKPSHVSIKISDSHDSLSIFPCDEDDVMAFRVPLKLFTDHKCVMRINSKQFVHGIMRTNQMDTSKTYVLSGEFLEEKNTAVFSLVEGVSLRTQKGVAQP